MYEGHNQAIFDLLAAQQAVEPSVLQLALARAEDEGKSLAALLVEHGVIEQAALLQAIARHLGCACDLDLPVELPARVRGLLNAELARACGAVPVAWEGTIVSFAALDPFKPDLVEDLAFAVGHEVNLVVADPGRIERLLRQHYSAQEAALAAVAGDLAETAAEPIDESALTELDLAQLAGQERIIRFVNLTLAQAIRDRASDIHFEPYEQEFRIRYRIDGALQELAPPPRAMALPVISRLKVLANVNIAERRVPQDGRIRLTLAGRAVDLRLSTLPTQFGESVVLRVLDQSAGRLELSELGLPGKIRESVAAILRRPSGIFVVTGPTGSGKTTTLYSCLQQLNTPEVKMLTVEDPVEYEIDGLMQVPVNVAAGLTFSRALRTFLRQDPDIVMVGEVRDAETAQIAMQASLTGHLVLTTLHTNDAPSAVTRLVDMGVEPFLIASTVEAILAQRLLRRNCPVCRGSYQPSESLLQQLEMAPGTFGAPFYRGNGCAECHHTGYRGRLGLFEFLPMSDALRELTARGASLLDLKQQAVAEGMVTLRAAGISALLAGDTSAEEVMKYT